jgi:hypothetical protein
LAVVALFVPGAPAAAIVLAVPAVTGTVLVARFDQWEA